jgi:hypothetical protein
VIPTFDDRIDRRLAVLTASCGWGCDPMADGPDAYGISASFALPR